MIDVDEPRTWDKRYQNWCHCWSGSGNDFELHDFAQKLRLPRTWMHVSHGMYGVVFKHYDLSPSKRELAIRLGAKFKPLIEWIKEQRMQP